MKYIPEKFKELKDKILKKKNSKIKDNTTQSDNQKEVNKSAENKDSAEKESNHKSKEPEIHNDSNSIKDPTKMPDMIKTINLDKLYELRYKAMEPFSDLVGSYVSNFKLVYNTDLDTIYKYIDDFKKDYKKYEAKQKHIESVISETDNELEKILNTEIYMKLDQFASMAERICSSCKKVDLHGLSEAEKEAKEFKSEIINEMKDNNKEITDEVCTALNNLLSEHTKVLKFRIELENTCIKEMNKIYSIMYKEISKAAK